MDQNISVTVDGKKQDQKVNMNMKTDVIQEPIAMYQEIKMTMPGNDQTQEIKQYITQEEYTCSRREPGLNCLTTPRIN